MKNNCLKRYSVDSRPTTVCTTVNMVTVSYGSEITWTLGSCENEKSYGDGEIANQECCQAPGTMELECKDSYGDGWNGGYLEINGKEYCKDFDSGTEKKEQVTITGKNHFGINAIQIISLTSY